MEAEGVTTWAGAKKQLFLGRQVVSERLGHRGVEITMDIYQHVLPDMQEEAAERMESVLFVQGR